MRKRILLSLSVVFLHYQILFAYKYESYYFDRDGKSFVFVSGPNSYTDTEVARLKKSFAASFESVLYMLSTIKHKKKLENASEYHFYLEKKKKSASTLNSNFRFGMPSLSYCFSNNVISRLSDTKKSYEEVSIRRLSMYIKKLVKKQAKTNALAKQKPKRNGFRKKVSTRVITSLKSIGQNKQEV